MKTTSTITIKYPNHNTQKTVFPLCALLLDTPNREDANRRKTDIPTLQVNDIVNAKLTEGYRLPAHYVIHTTDLIRHGGTSGETDLIASCYHSSLSLHEHQHRYLRLPHRPSRDDHRGNRARDAENLSRD